jgi:chromosomal replication initiator protein
MTEAPPVLTSPTFAEIRGEICDHFRVTEREILSAQRARYVARPRQVAMYLSRHLTLHSLPTIGKFFGGRDHTTVLHACRVIEQAKRSDEKFARTLAVLASRLERQAANRRLSCQIEALAA